MGVTFSDEFLVGVKQNITSTINYALHLESVFDALALAQVKIETLGREMAVSNQVSLNRKWKRFGEKQFGCGKMVEFVWLEAIVSTET